LPWCCHWSASPTRYWQAYQSAAKQDNPGFSSFSAAAGQKLYTSEGSKQLSCASCHTASPKNPGKHAKTNKDIEPLAPSANPKRFTDAAQVEKWFKRNCNDVLGRACTSAGKGRLHDLRVVGEMRLAIRDV
jgi:hypothetical protein